MSRLPPRHARRGASGFTLLELLAVIIILGICAAVLIPQLSGGAERVRLVTAARSIVQASRYARTMALLHQAETELVLDPSTGDVSVHAHSSGSKGDLLAELAAERSARQEALAEAAPDDGLDAEPAGVETNRAAEIATAQSFADEISQSFANKDISFAFLEYTDTIDNDRAKPERDAPATDEDKSPITLVFRSNGTCRPFRVRALTEDGDHLDVAVDAIGKAKIEGYGDED